MIEAEERNPEQFYSWPKQSSTNCRTVREIHNLQDKSRLIKRTQLKRSVYRILGKSEPSNSKSANENEEISVSKQDMLLKNYDPEIFDDDDFYRQILKDIIDSKSFGPDAEAIR
ncbi:protein AATF [Trichonephila clavipes]|nr:protein AATF [Trichonephila clavipes]